MDENGVLCEPRGFRHRQCYQTYTSSKMLCAFQIRQEVQTPKLHTKTDRSSERFSRSNVQLTDLKLCLFCQRAKKLKKVPWQEEPLAKCPIMDGSASVKSAAVASQDPRLLVAVEGVDLIAMDIVCHASCFRDNTRKSTIERLCRNNSLTA